MVPKIAAGFCVIAVAFAPVAHAEPQCWDRYSLRNDPQCNGGNTPGQLPGAGGNGSGGLLGILHGLTGGLL